MLCGGGGGLITMMRCPGEMALPEAEVEAEGARVVRLLQNSPPAQNGTTAESFRGGPWWQDASRSLECINNHNDVCHEFQLNDARAPDLKNIVKQSCWTDRQPDLYYDKDKEQGMERHQFLENITLEMLNLEKLLGSSKETPLVVNVIYILLECRKRKNLDFAKQIHLHICEVGLERALENYIVSMFAGCGSLTSAEQAFHKLGHGNEYSWTSMIQGYTEHGESQYAINLYEKMQEDFVLPAMQTFIALLKACTVLKCAERSQEVYADIVKEGFERDLFIGSTLLDTYSKCGLFLEAQDIFDELPARDVVTWTALIAGYVEMGLAEEALTCFEQMEFEGVAPNMVTCVCCLKACANLGVIDRGQGIHATVVRYGFKGNTFVDSSLVDMYGKCGCLSEAQEVFNVLSVRDVVSWTALIAGYAEHGFNEEVLYHLEQMQLDGVSPNAATFACSLKSCSNIGATFEGQKIHSAITKQGFDKNHFVGSALVDMYAKCGLLTEAKEVFDELSIRDVVSWNTLLAGYFEHGLGEEVLNCYQNMQLEGVSPNAATWACSLKSCSNMGAIDRGQEIHTQIVKQGCEKENLVGSALVDIYARCGLLAEAKHLSIELSMRDVALWNALIAGYAEHGFGKEALDCYQKMQLEGVLPDAVTFICSLKACCSVGAIDRGGEIHAEIVKKGLERDAFIGSTLVDIYAKCGLLAEAQDVFDVLLVRDVVMWNTLIAGYAEHGAGEEALHQLKEMESECVSWNAVTFACCLKACVSAGFIVWGQAIHAKMVKEGYETHHLVGNILVDLYAKWGSLAEAKCVFEELPCRDVVSWTALLSGYAEHGFADESWSCLEQMKLEGVSPNAVTFVSILKVLGNIGDIDRGREIHIEVVKLGFETEHFVSNLLMDVYARCGSVAEAQEAFDKLPVRDVVSWTALLAGYTGSRLCEEALDCLQQMQLEGVAPDTVAFSSSLKACGSLGDAERGQDLHSEMAKKGLEQNQFVGNSLVDMYAKCGLLVEARKILDTLPVRDVVSWNALLAGYTEHGLGEEALNCYEQMQLEGVSPDAVTAISSVKSCGSIGSIDKGRELHFQIVKVAYDINLFPDSDSLAAVLATALVDMYGRCGNMVDAQKMFDTMITKELVVWNALINGYSRQGESGLVFSLFDGMREDGVHPDGITFLCILTVCSHAGLADKSQEYFESMSDEYHISPMIKHYSCMVDLLGRLGRLDEAVAMVESIPIKLDLVVWSTMLSACRKWGNVEVGRQAFEQAVQLDEHHTAAFLLMFNIYADAHVGEE